MKQKYMEILGGRLVPVTNTLALSPRRVRGVVSENKFGYLKGEVVRFNTTHLVSKIRFLGIYLGVRQALPDNTRLGWKK